MAKARPQPQTSRVVAAFGVPKAFASRWMKPAESPIAVVEAEETVKATACGPCCSAARRIAAAVRFSASSQLIRSQPGSGSPFGAGAAQRVGQPLGMIDEFRRGAAFGAERLAGRVRGIGFEPREAAVFDHGDAAASGDAEPAITVNALACWWDRPSRFAPVVRTDPVAPAYTERGVGTKGRREGVVDRAWEPAGGP